MANNLGLYNPIFYAQEAILQLEKALGMAARVYRGYEEERKTFGRGDTISIKKPSTFTASDAPSVAQDVNTDKVDLTLNFWREVKFKLTDRELALSSEQIIADHIRPGCVCAGGRCGRQPVAPLQGHSVVRRGECHADRRGCDQRPAEAVR
jgi:hypothetical protein